MGCVRRRRAANDSARASYDQSVALYRQTVLTALQEAEANLAAAALLEQELVVQQDAQATALATETTLLNLQNRRLAAAATLLKNIAGRWDADLLIGQPTRTVSPP